jgi:hypothetical protein
MATPQPRAPAERPPPDLPHFSDKTENSLVNYLRTFSLWCRQTFADKLDRQTALPGVLLQTYDTAPGAMPSVYQLGVNSDPRVALTPILLGGANPETRGAKDAGTPITFAWKSETDALSTRMNGYLPLTGGSLSSELDVSGTISLHAAAYAGGNAYVGFFDSNGTRRGYMGWVGGLTMTNDTSGANLSVGDDGYVRATAIMLSSNVGWIAMPGQYSGINVVSPGSNDAFITYLSPAAYGLNVGLNANGYFYRGGWSDGNHYYNFWTSREWGGPSCDYRMKEKVERLDSTWARVKALKPIKYRQREVKAKQGRSLCEADDRERWGFMAHELQEILGETAAHCRKDDPDILQSINANMVIAALVRTVQELQARVEALER